MSNLIIAYNKFLVFDTEGRLLHPCSNVSDYDIHPEYTGNMFRLEDIEQKLNIKFPYKLTGDEDEKFYDIINFFNSENFFSTFYNPDGDYMAMLVDEAIKINETFVYPIMLYNNDLFEKYDTIDFSEKLLLSLKNKRCKIVFTQLTEGFFGYKDSHYIWFSNLAKRHNLDKKSLIMVTANLHAEDHQKKLISQGRIEDNFKIYSYPYFENNLWFYYYGHILIEDLQNKLSEDFDYFLEKNRTEKKKLHFLCFNRIVKPHRVVMFSELMTNPKLINKSIVTCASGTGANFFNHGLKKRYGEECLSRINNFIDNHDITKHYTYDEEDLENNKANNFNKEAQNSTFVNVVTESLLYKNVVFFSEKTYKPIAALQPFIIFGNAYSLKKLKEQGYRTFDKWWDESYDDEIDYTSRARKIIDLMEEISTWSMEKCFRITNEMEEVLIHNHKVLKRGKRLVDLNNFLIDKKLL